MQAAREDTEIHLEQRRVELPDSEEITLYVADFRDFLMDGSISERKVLVRNFIEGIEVEGVEATLTYTAPMPRDRVKSEAASVPVLSSSARAGPVPLKERPAHPFLNSPDRRIVQTTRAALAR